MDGRSLNVSIMNERGAAAPASCRDPVPSALGSEGPSLVVLLNSFRRSRSGSAPSSKRHFGLKSQDEMISVCWSDGQSMEEETG